MSINATGCLFGDAFGHTSEGLYHENDRAHTAKSATLSAVSMLWLTWLLSEASVLVYKL